MGTLAGVAPTVEAVNASPGHTMSKPPRSAIRLVEGVGVDGDAHAGVTVKHRSRVRADPTQPNLRQVHLIPTELHAALRCEGFEVGAGQMGENITTRGVDLLGLPVGTRLVLGSEATVELTGLRNPCGQLNGVQAGLMDAVLHRDPDGNLVRKAGVMAVVLVGGEVRPGDPIVVHLPSEPHQPLRPV